MLNHYKLAIPRIDSSITNYISRQCTDKSSKFCGVIPDFIKGFNEAWDGCRQAEKLITAYYTPESAYYHDPLMLERASLAIDFSLKRVNADGSIDLMECNFHDSTANGFAMRDLGPAILVMMRDTTHTDAESELLEKLITFARASAEAMINLGFHTPNHRWVLSAGLSYCYKITGDTRCLDHINKFLAEGIDCDENGEYTERSSGTYNAVCNSSLLAVSDLLRMPELRDHIARNLRLGMKFFDPDNTVNTLNSTRQDFGNVIGYSMYYHNYVMMALFDGDTNFAYLADRMFEAGGTPDLANFLLHPEWIEKQSAIVPEKPDFDCDAYMPNSGIVRWRKNDVSCTLIKERPAFCQLQKGSHRIMLRMAGAFFGRGQFIPQTLEKTESGYRLYMKKEAGYLRPFDEPQQSPFWADMDHSKRETTALQTLAITVDIKIGEHRLDIDVNTDDCGNIPVKLEFIMDPGAILDLGSAEFFTRAGDYVYLKNGDVSYTYADGCAFRFCSAFGEHHWGRTMRDSIHGDGGKVTLTMTGITPISRSIAIEF